MPVISTTGEGDRKIMSSRPAWAKLVRPYLKNKIKQKDWIRTSCYHRILLSKPEVLNSIPSTTKKKERKK
jgi:hypothetical protein